MGLLLGTQSSDKGLERRALLCVLELWLVVDPCPKSLKRTRKADVARAVHLTAE